MSDNRLSFNRVLRACGGTGKQLSVISELVGWLSRLTAERPPAGSFRHLPAIIMAIHLTITGNLLYDL